MGPWSGVEAAVEAVRVEVRLLGPVEVFGDGRPLPLHGTKQRSVLAALALAAGRVVPFARLVDTVWGPSPPATAHRQILNAVSGLRRAIGPVVVTKSAGYLLDCGKACTDLDRFDAACAAARQAATAGRREQAAELMRAGLTVWRGPALGGTIGLDAEASMLEERRLAAVQERIGLDLVLGRHAELPAELAALVAAYPLREQLREQLLVALYRCGRQAEALAAYRKGREVLAEELGVEPGAELQRLHQAILRGEPTLDPPMPAGAAVMAPAHAAAVSSAVPAQLPAAGGAFVGRSGCFKELDGLLDSDNVEQPVPVVISVIAGGAGVGKTALAVHWAHQVATRFPDGQLYIDLRGFSPGPPLSPLRALGQLLHGLGVEADKIPVEVDQAAGLYRSLLSRKRVLVLLDNARDAEQVRPLLPGGRGCMALVTSRDRLGGLVASHCARRLVLDVLGTAEAATLLERVLGEDRVRAEPDATAKLAAVCGYLPLALRIVAANLDCHPDWPIAGYVARLRRDNQLAELAVDNDSRAAVRAAFDCSYAVFTEDARRLFRLLGLVPGPAFTAPAAAALADMTVEQASRLLERLAGAHLVEPRGPGRFGFHDLVALYARQRSHNEDGEEARRQALGRLLGWYLGSADAAAQVLYPQMLRLPVPEAGPPVAPFAGHAEALAWLDAERANLVAAVQHAAAHGPRRAGWLLADALRTYFLGNQHMLEWLAVAHAGMAAAQAEGELQAQAAAQRSLGWAHFRLGDAAKAVTHHTSALRLARQAGWVDGEATILGNLGVVYAQRGELQRAAEQHAQILLLFGQTGFTAGRAVALGNLGDVNRQLGRPKQAVDQLTEALGLYRQLGTRGGQAATLASLGEAYRDLGRLKDAARQLGQALALAKEVGDRFQEAWGTSILASVCNDAGRQMAALQVAEAALGLARQTGDRRIQAEALTTLGSVRLRLGHSQQASRHHHEALDLAGQTSAPSPQIEALLGLAASWQENGQHLRAAQHAQQALTIAHQGSFRLLEGRAHGALADIYLSQGSHNQAREQANRALAIHNETGYRLGRARALVVLGHALQHADDSGAAQSCWQEALALFTDIGTPEATPVRALLDTRRRFGAGLRVDGGGPASTRAGIPPSAGSQ